ncbi:MAG: hypothetical protein ACOX57_05630 [Limnochordia bacterium]|jgi:hypothetical protein
MHYFGVNTLLIASPLRSSRQGFGAKALQRSSEMTFRTDSDDTQKGTVLAIHSDQLRVCGGWLGFVPCPWRSHLMVTGEMG